MKRQESKGFFFRQPAKALIRLPADAHADMSLRTEHMALVLSGVADQKGLTNWQTYPDQKRGSGKNVNFL